mgnify:CR=1 FL=1
MLPPDQITSILLRETAGLLRQAERPILVSGSGILWSQASAELRQFVELSGIPFYTTPQGRGVIPEDHDLCFLAARTTACSCVRPMSPDRLPIVVDMIVADFVSPGKLRGYARFDRERLAALGELAADPLFALGASAPKFRETVNDYTAQLVRRGAVKDSAFTVTADSAPDVPADTGALDMGFDSGFPADCTLCHGEPATGNPAPPRPHRRRVRDQADRRRER